jgi:hypothetical protein
LSCSFTGREAVATVPEAGSPDALTDAGVATLLFDLLTPLEEAEDRWRGHLSFDIPFLAGRLMAAMDWACDSPMTRDLGIGFSERAQARPRRC